MSRRYRKRSIAWRRRLLRAAVPLLVLGGVRRHFPLDPACNPAVRRRIHPSACNLARAAVCAEAQGRLEGMEDALFANQRERLPVETLATRVGLDLGRFRACLDSPETERRLATDVAAATRGGVRSTPSYVVDGAVYSRRFPAERLPPIVPTNGGWSRPRATDPDDRSTR